MSNVLLSCCTVGWQLEWEGYWNTAIKNTRHYATSTWSKRKRDLHGQPMPDHRKRKKLKQWI
jgi:ribosomal protein L35